MNLIETKVGPLPCQLDTADGMVRLHVFHTPGGAGLFVVFPEGHIEQAKDAVRKLIDAGPLEPNIALTDKVPGCIVAGTVAAPKIQFGIPHVAHAEEGGAA